MKVSVCWFTKTKMIFVITEEVERRSTLRLERMQRKKLRDVATYFLFTLPNADFLPVDSQSTLRFEHNVTQFFTFSKGHARVCARAGDFVSSPSET